MSILHDVRHRFRVIRLGNTEAARRLGVAIGQGSRVYTRAFGTEPWLVRIGERSTVSSEVRFITHDGIGELFRDGKGRRYRYAPVAIGDDTFIGLGSILLPGVSVGDRCVVAAGSVVTRSVPSGTVVAGNPAREITTFDELMKRVERWPSDADRSGRSYREFVDEVSEGLISV